MSRPPPALSVIMMMPYSFARLSNGIACLQRQTVREQIEFILVHAPGRSEEIDPAQFHEFHSFQRVELDEGFPLATGFAAGFRAGSAPVVAYIEDHVTINPEWAEAIIDAHRGPWVAVAPAMENANHPKLIVGRMTFLEAFVDWYGQKERCEISSGPGHNTSYKRTALEYFGDRLSELYGSERNLCYQIEAAGGKMLMEPRAVTRHVNISKFGVALTHGYYGGQIFGAHRGASMSGLEKALRTALAPAVPVLRLGRIMKILWQRHKFTEIGFLAVMPSFLLCLAFHAAGEIAGYWGDSHAAEIAYRKYEMNRLDYVAKRDRPLLLPNSDGPG